MDSSIKGKYCVLMAQERKLYIFDTEDSKKPKEIINLSVSKCRPLHESLFPNGIVAGSYGFQIISYANLNQMNNLNNLGNSGIGSSSNLSDNVVGGIKSVQTHYFILESLKEKMEWLGTLRPLTRCCSSCSPNYEKQIQGPVPEASDYHSDQCRVYRTIKIGILEAQNLPISEVLRRTIDAYCTISLDDAKVFKSIVKYGNLNPFWGEEVLLE